MLESTKIKMLKSTSVPKIECRKQKPVKLQHPQFGIHVQICIMDMIEFII